VGEGFLAFFFQEAKIQNGEWIPFCQKFCMVFSSILQNDGPKPKIFWVKWETKHTLYLSQTVKDASAHRDPTYPPCTTMMQTNKPLLPNAM
jgi:hypothetical protein